MGFFRNSSSKGFAMAGIVAIVVIISAAAGAGYYVMTRDDSVNDNNTELSSEQQKEVEVECKKEIDDKDFCKFASNWNINGEYRITFTTSGGSESGTIVSEIDGKNSSTVLTAADGQESKFISFNGASYTFNPDTSVWLKFNSEASTSDIIDSFNEFDFDNEDVPELERDTYEAQGKEACGNLNCFKYKIVDPRTQNIEQYFWFDDEDYKLRRFLIVDGDTTTDAAIEYVDVTITEPSPVKEFSQPEGVPNESEMQELLNSLPQ